MIMVMEIITDTILILEATITGIMILFITMAGTHLLYSVLTSETGGGTTIHPPVTRRGGIPETILNLLFIIIMCREGESLQVTIQGM
jgi:hypothetical protein